MYQHRLVTLSLAALFLGSCSLIPPSVQTSSNDTSLPIQNVQNISGSSRKIAVPASYTAPQQQSVAKTVSFPNMVKTTEINEPQLTEVQEVESLLKAEGIDIDDLDSLDDGGFNTQSFNSRRLFFAQFKTSVGRRARSYQVKIPANGQFELKLKEGSRYKILDNDATDGTAVIQMPAATLKTWLHLNRNWRNDSELKVEDPLYYVSDTLSSERKKWFSRTRWLSMGLRPLPVPSEWGSPHGNDFVLNMTAKNVKAFSMIWLQKNAEPVLPPFGIKKIGPEGGTVELPGIGKIEIPADALETLTTIRLEQITEAKPPIQLNYPGLDDYHEEEFVSPVLRIYPQGLELKKRALLVLSLNAERIGNNTSLAANYKYTENANGIDNWLGIGRKTPLPRNLEVFPLDYPAEVYKFGDFSAFIFKGVGPNDGGTTLFPSVPEFSVQSSRTTNLPTNKQLDDVMTKYDYRSYPCYSANSIYSNVKQSDIPATKVKYKAALQYCNTVFRYYVYLMDHSGKVKGNKNLMPKLPYEPADLRFSPFPFIGEKPFYTMDMGHPKNLTTPNKLRSGRAYSEVVNAKNLADLSDAIAHEIWHAFQYANRTGFGWSRIHGNDEWLIEGSAQVMGTHIARLYPMALPPATIKNRSYSETYVGSVEAGIQASGTIPLYELAKANENIDYRSSAFFTFLSGEYGDIPKMHSRLATYFSTKKNNSLIEGLDNFIQEEHNLNSSLNLLPEQYVGFSHSAISKETLNTILPISDYEFKQEPDGFRQMAANAHFKIPFMASEKIKGLKTNFYKVRIANTSVLPKPTGPISMIVKTHSTTPKDFRATALLYNSIDLGKYPRVPTKRMWNSQGIGLFNEQSKTENGRSLFITSNLNTTYSDIYLAVTNVNFEEDVEKEYDIEIKFLRASNPTGTKPSKQGSLAEKSTRLVLTVENSDCLNKSCSVLVESIDGKSSPAKIISVKVTKQDENKKTIEEEMVVQIPGSAKKGGFIYVDQEGIIGAKLDDAVYVCNMLPKDISFTTQSFSNTSEKLKPCLAK